VNGQCEDKPLVCGATQVVVNGQCEDKEIPKWIKDNARGFAEDKISDKDFATGIAFMIKEEIIKVDNVKIDKDNDVVISDDIKIPDWIQNNAKWWADGLISDQEFKSGIEYMVKEKIIDISGDDKIDSKQELQLIKSSLKGGLFNTIITDTTVKNKANAVESLVKIATINQISSQINLEIRNYLDDFLEDEIDRAWELHSKQQTSESEKYAISLYEISKQNKNEQTKWLTLTKNSIQAKEDLLNSAQKAGFNKVSLEKMSIKEFGEYEDRIKTESDLKNAIQELESLKKDFGGLLFQLDLELDVSDFGSNSDAVTVWCAPQQLDASDSKLVVGICSDIPTT